MGIKEIVSCKYTFFIYKNFFLPPGVKFILVLYKILQLLNQVFSFTILYDCNGQI